MAKGLTMEEHFDSSKIAQLGWRQGAVLNDDLKQKIESFIPENITVSSSDWLIVTSHDCDVVNYALAKEPVVELLKTKIESSSKPDKQQSLGRNPRNLQIHESEFGLVLSCSVHERWAIPRELLMSEAPDRFISKRNCRIIAEWLAKRYIRAAFPSAFDSRWRSKMKNWVKLLRKHSFWIQGVYLKLNTLEELESDEPYICSLLVAVPVIMTEGDDWQDKFEEIEDDILTFWDIFAPRIKCDEVDVLSTDNITLDRIETYQRFDADWVSFADDTPMTSSVLDFTT